MTSNMGKSDRIIRVILGAVIVAAGVYYESWWGLIGIIPIATSVIGFCPAYAPLKITTKK